VSSIMRERRRHLREMPAEPDVIVAMAGGQGSLEHEIEQGELLRCVCAAVNDLLSARQRRVLLALAVDGRSPETVAAEIGATVGAVYKGLHDARRKLRAHLRASGFAAAG
jgi:RNA polymerase sigma-70 factor (ECF subfamily)